MGHSFTNVLLRVGFAIMLLVAPLGFAQAGGAIAIGSCAAYGYAFDFRDLGEAQAAALAKCSEKSCKVALTMKRACGAFAIDGTNACGAHGYAVAPRLGEAQNKALRACHNFGGRECVIRAWACDAEG
ncbi:MAG: DUF4189 domain-containing protein [Xanthobacteraceae bacterium]